MVGGIFIVIGTCLGAGLLALPIGTAQCGFTYSSALLLGCWIITSIGAFYILEVTQWLPRGSNIISEAKATLGRWGEAISWLLYLVLCYSLLCAYIAGGSDIFHLIISLLKVTLSQPVTALLFVIVLGSVVFKGVRSLDLVNRCLMILKFLAFFALIVLIAPHIKADNFIAGSGKYALSAFTIAMTSFGFAIVVPTLLEYFDGNVKKVRLILFIGTLIPFLFYISWNFVIMGSISTYGSDGLVDILNSGDITSGLANSLKNVIKENSITEISRLFASICMLTSFLGVSLSFTDFIADGFRIKKTFAGKWKIFLITYVPPLIIVSVYPQIFMNALSYAGILTLLLLVMLPAAMVWRGRYIKKISKGYKVIGGKFLIIIIFLVSVLIIAGRLLQGMGFLKSL
jgi:tyrosine-specific transport protein